MEACVYWWKNERATKTREKSQLHHSQAIPGKWIPLFHAIQMLRTYWSCFFFSSLFSQINWKCNQNHSRNESAEHEDQKWMWGIAKISKRLYNLFVTSNVQLLFRRRILHLHKKPIWFLSKFLKLHTHVFLGLSGLAFSIRVSFLSINSLKYNECNTQNYIFSCWNNYSNIF